MADDAFPSYAYFNVYVLATSSDNNPAQALFVSATGMDGRGCRLYVDSDMLPGGLTFVQDLTFYIQGVTYEGEVLTWDRCAYVDVPEVVVSLPSLGLVIHR